ncbi:hypothetical protein ACOMHN_030542 [Nucella lapillus]
MTGIITARVSEATARQARSLRTLDANKLNDRLGGRATLHSISSVRAKIMEHQQSVPDFPRQAGTSDSGKEWTDPYALTLELADIGTASSQKEHRWHSLYPSLPVCLVALSQMSVPMPPLGPQ